MTKRKMKKGTVAGKKSSDPNKSLPCRCCTTMVHNVGHDAIAVTCSICVSAAMSTPVAERSAA